MRPKSSIPPASRAASSSQRSTRSAVQLAADSTIRPARLGDACLLRAPTGAPPRWRAHADRASPRHCRLRGPNDEQCLLVRRVRRWSLGLRARARPSPSSFGMRERAFERPDTRACRPKRQHGPDGASLPRWSSSAMALASPARGLQIKRISATAASSTSRSVARSVPDTRACRPDRQHAERPSWRPLGQGERQRRARAGLGPTATSLQSGSVTPGWPLACGCLGLL